MPPRKTRVPSPNKKQPSYHMVMGLEIAKIAFPVAAMLFNVFLSLTAFVQYQVPDNVLLLVASLPWGIVLGLIYLAIKKAADPGPLLGSPSDSLLITMMFAGLLMSSIGIGQFINCTFDDAPKVQQVLRVAGKDATSMQEDIYHINVRPEPGQWPMRRLRVSKQVHDTVEPDRSTVILNVNPGLFGYRWLPVSDGVMPVVIGPPA